MPTGMIRLRALTVRYAVKTGVDGAPVRIDRVVSTPRECANVLRTLLQDEPAEVFAILCLTTKHRVIAYHEVSRGTLDSALVDPRQVFTGALLAHAAAIIGVHVHPSGVMHTAGLCGLIPSALMN